MDRVSWARWRPATRAPRLTGRTLPRMAREVGARLSAVKSVLATAESCTGGGLSWLITTAPGSSAWFDRGFVVYQNRAKEEMLGVPSSALLEHGAVSEPTARAMAEGACDHSQADVAVAVTGIAGPDGGTDDKPVGTVWFAWARVGWGVRTRRFLFKGDRDAVRSLSCQAALAGLLLIPGLIPDGSTDTAAPC